MFWHWYDIISQNKAGATLTEKNIFQSAYYIRTISYYIQSPHPLPPNRNVVLKALIDHTVHHSQWNYEFPSSFIWTAPTNDIDFSRSNNFLHSWDYPWQHMQHCQAGSSCTCPHSLISRMDLKNVSVLFCIILWYWSSLYYVCVNICQSLCLVFLQSNPCRSWVAPRMPNQHPFIARFFVTKCCQYS